MRVFKSAVITTLLAASFPLTCAADVDWGLNHALNDTWAFELGALYAAKTSNTAQLDSTKLGVGTNVNFQDMLGMNSWAWGPDVAARWRMSEKWRLEASYFWISQSGSKSISQDIQWGDVVFPVNAQVDSKLNFADFRTSVGYSFYKTSDKELGVGLGLHVLGYQASLSSTTLGTEGGNILAPLPVVSFYGGFAMNEHWSVSARLDVFSLTYEQYHGSITSLGLDVVYQPFRHVGFGLGYRALVIDFQADSTGLGSFQGKYNQTLQGPAMYVTLTF
jgi:hypothetical protein